jgi:acetoin utilization deacetylase AcuC-like enzyme
MAKFRLLHDELLRQGLANTAQFHQPQPVPRRWLELVHGRPYHQAFARGQLSAADQRRIGLPATTPLVQRTWLAVGGTHHAFPHYGSGFCIFNDCAVAAQVLLAEGAIERLMLVDLDVHQGDGTAAIFAGNERVFTFSAHCASNFPLRKQQSDVDLPLADGLEDDAYLVAVGERLPDLLDQVNPQLVIYNAGVDPHRGDRLGRLCLSSEGLLKRDHLVLDACLRRRIPIATVIGGGYDNLAPLVQRHSLVFRAASEQARLHGL